MVELFIAADRNMDVSFTIKGETLEQALVSAITELGWNVFSFEPIIKANYTIVENENA
jgi:hypothetical protein